MLREGHWRAVAVVTRDDAHALRLTLLSAHVRPDLPLWVTMFDHTVSRELEHVAPKVHVLSPSEIVAGDLAEGCLALKPATRSSAAIATASASSTTPCASSSSPAPASSRRW